MANRVAAFAAVVTFGVATSAKSLLEEPGPTFGYLSEPEEQQVRKVGVLHTVVDFYIDAILSMGAFFRKVSRFMGAIPAILGGDVSNFMAARTLWYKACGRRLQMIHVMFFTRQVLRTIAEHTRMSTGRVRAPSR